MSGRSMRTTLVSIASLAAAALLAACPELPQREELFPEWDEGFDTDDTDDTGIIVVTEPFALRVATDVFVDYHMYDRDDPDADCEVTPTGQPGGFPNANIECILEAQELDLYGNGLDFDFFVPAGACEYVVYWHYQYEAWEVGTGPTQVSYDVDDNGNVFNETNSINGVPFCQYDYSYFDNDAPNCCLGNYTLTVTNIDTSEVNIAGPIFWGGRTSDCYGGASFWDPEASFNQAGWPVSKIIFLAEQPWSKRFVWPLLAVEYVSNVVLANYYEPAEHNGSAPAGLTAPFAQPWYTFQCYDHAEELLAQIRLTVREWNTEADFYPMPPSGDPDTTGTEPSGLPLDDRDDWATGTPGDALWIEWGE